MRSILLFQDNTAPIDEQCGSKAARLMEQYKTGQPVPEGLILTVEFFEPWREAIRSGTDGKALKLSDSQRSSLNERLAEMNLPEGTLFAVRSSSPEEDLDNASFAGAYETVLGVSHDKLESAVHTCFLSAYDARIATYKKERGIQSFEPKIAVLVQQLINADAAGVAFSLNPLNNCYDEAVINTNFGLGESVVSGESEPDLFVVDKLQRAIVGRTCGGKELLIQPGERGGTIRNTLPHAASFSITDVEALRIAGLVSEMEETYRQPVDIEWAMERGKLYLLQVRPITTYHPLPEEMITAPDKPKRLYANSTLIEQGLEKPLSVLGTDFLSHVLRQMTGAMGGGAVIGVNGASFTIGGQYYMDVGLMRKLTGGNELAPGSSDDQTVLAILNSMDLSPYVPRKLPKELKKAKRGTMLSTLKYAKQIKAAMANPQGFLTRYREELPDAIRKFSAPVSPCGSLEECAKAVTQPLDFFLMKYGLPTLFGANKAREEHALLFAEEDDSVQDDLHALSAALPGNKTAEMGQALYALAASPEFSQYSNANDLLKALESGSIRDEFVAQWHAFLKEYGARCSREIDVAAVRPHEMPGMVYEQAKALQEAAQKGDFFAKAIEKREAAHERLSMLAAQKSKHCKAAFDRNYEILFAFGGFRETGKHYIIQAVDMFRQRALQIGDQLVRQVRLSDARQIFDLTIADIDHALVNPDINLQALCDERTKFINKLNRSPFAVRIIDARGKIFMPPPCESEKGVYNGVAISPGVAKGRAKVLHVPDEKELLPGEILVARATNPGWTPLFINAAGIVLEIGGTLQHGAVVAREYGIPCVSGITGAVERIQDGQLVEVDGSNGILRVVDETCTDDDDPSRLAAEKEKRRMERVQKKRQAMKRRVLQRLSLLLIPLIPLLLVVVFYAIFHALMGQGLAASFSQLKDLWGKYSGVLRITTVIFPVFIIGAFVLRIVRKRKKTSA